MAVFRKLNVTNSITVADGWVTIHGGLNKWRDARGDVVVPAGAITRVTNDDGLVKIHVDGVPQPAPKGIDGGNHNRYAVFYTRHKTAEAVVAEVKAAMEMMRGVPLPTGWVPAPQSPKTVKQAAKKSYEEWEAEQKAKRLQDEENRRAAAVAAKEQKKAAEVAAREKKKAAAEKKAAADAAAAEKILRAGEPPRFLDAVIAGFGGLSLYDTGTIAFSGELFDARGAQGIVYAHQTTSRKLSTGRIIAGATAIPMVGAAGLAGLIPKQTKDTQIILEIYLTDGRSLVAVGDAKHQKDALKVIEKLSLFGD